MYEEAVARRSRNWWNENNYINMEKKKDEKKRTKTLKDERCWWRGLANALSLRLR